MTLFVKESFVTLQGEGHWAGTPSVFVRFIGCNLWAGTEETRTRDAQRTGAQCPLFCDTDFVGSHQKYSVDELADHIAELARAGTDDPIKHIVFTGGEPMMQMNTNPDLLKAVRSRFRGFVRLAVETNGTVYPHPKIQRRLGEGQTGFDWICVSPKVPLKELEITSGEELKVVFPAYDPLEYQTLEHEFDELLVSPEFPPGPGSLVSKSNLDLAIKFCLKHPKWRLSLQQHKHWDIP